MSILLSPAMALDLFYFSQGMIYGARRFLLLGVTFSLYLRAPEVRKLMTPGGDVIPPIIYLITQENCINCPAAKAVVEEALNGTDVQVKTIDLQEMDSDFEFRLLESQVFIASTPAILLENNGKLRMLYSGKVPTVDGIRDAAGVS